MVRANEDDSGGIVDDEGMTSGIEDEEVVEGAMGAAEVVVLVDVGVVALLVGGQD